MSHRVIVTIADDRLDAVDAVVDGLVDAGLQVDTVLSATGLVIGSVQDEKLPAVARVAGVAAVEREGEKGVLPIET